MTLSYFFEDTIANAVIVNGARYRIHLGSHTSNETIYLIRQPFGAKCILDDKMLTNRRDRVI